jgi:phosphopantothenoylcysteine decarboxylase/phosphopantothenate--cysteine ligase
MQRGTMTRPRPKNRARTAPRATADSLAGFEVLVCVCGGIAAYKTAALVSLLVQRNCGVTVAMTRAARRFVGPVTFQALSGRRVYTSMWPHESAGEIQHLSLSQTAQLVVVAPATADVIGKLAGGLADDLVTSLLLGAACPVLLAPAMNAKMWAHPAVQRNVKFLRDNGFSFVGPNSGWQACREVGPGRMAEPEELLSAITTHLLTRRA